MDEPRPPDWMARLFDQAEVDEWAAATERGDPADTVAYAACMRRATERAEAEGRNENIPVTHRSGAAVHGAG